MSKKSLVITSIAPSTMESLHTYTNECKKRGLDFILIGDTKSPADFHIDECDFWSVDRQLTLSSEFAKICPTRHYARKNIGYIIAMQRGTDEIVETDDDNYPREEFWKEHNKVVNAKDIRNLGWVNVYKYFADSFIWPRGLPLEELQKPLPELDTFKDKDITCPIQQGLADENPDVDAVFRLAFPLPLNFKKIGNIALGDNAWCPFNSQNTYWYKEAFPLLYLPSYCSFRMTDIWRSYVAQRISWANGWSVLFHDATVWQERNEHNLMKDFEDEIPGYLNNVKICQGLAALDIKGGKENILNDLVTCYEYLTSAGFVGKEEMPLIHAWVRDLEKYWI
ncbi:MAG: STELLO glycosyltransferase family protein [Chitinophagales bacterium]|nr:STELLO glycosyltransferase family protein [Chitinophagales bacterium]MCZ2394673.1 STELLO glycosyltransferase family protein [Chitinophagales bacterium]